MPPPRHNLPLASILVRQSGPGVGGAHRAQAHLARAAEQRWHLAQSLAQDHRQRLVRVRRSLECQRQADHARQAVDRGQGRARLLGAQLGHKRLPQV